MELSARLLSPDSVKRGLQVKLARVLSLWHCRASVRLLARVRALLSPIVNGSNIYVVEDTSNCIFPILSQLLLGFCRCRNLKFWERKELDAEAAGPWRWVQAGYEHFLGFDSLHTN